MFKQNKKGIIVLLANPLFWIALVIITGLIYLPNSGLLSVFSPFEYAGFIFQEDNRVCSGGGSGSISLSGEFLVLQSSLSGNSCSPSTYSITTDVTTIDELLIIADANIYASAGAQSGAGSSFNAGIEGTQGGSIGSGFGLGVGTNEGGATKSQYFSPKVIKLKNNFDGTWSYLESLNVGDIFIVKEKKIITGNAILRLRVSSSVAGGGGSTNVQATVYNIVRKENAFALCKADEFVQDVNGDGKIATDGSECFNLQTIVLNSEEAIKESFDEKIARITAELEAKNAGLTSDIELLKQQLASSTNQQQITLLEQKIKDLEVQLVTATDKTSIQNQIDVLRQEQLQSDNLNDRLDALQAELAETKIILADVKAKDINVISTIESQEIFERPKPNFFEGLWNNFISFIKGILT